MLGFLSLFLIHNVESQNYGISFITGTLIEADVLL
jgi:hypothetical protein